MSDEVSRDGAESELFDLSDLTDISDTELRSRRARLGQIERERFLENLNASSFIATLNHLGSDRLDRARRRMDEEMSRRGLT